MTDPCWKADCNIFRVVHIHSHALQVLLKDLCFRIHGTGAYLQQKEINGFKNGYHS